MGKSYLLPHAKINFSCIKNLGKIIKCVEDKNSNSDQRIHIWHIVKEKNDVRYIQIKNFSQQRTP